MAGLWLVFWSKKLLPEQDECIYFATSESKIMDNLSTITSKRICAGRIKMLAIENEIVVGHVLVR
jgi:hypothetical protein